MSKPDTPVKEPPAPAPTSSESPAITQEQPIQAAEVSVEITGITASGLPAKVGFFSGVFYVSVKVGKVSQKTKTAKYIKGEDFAARWNDTIKLTGLESSRVEIEVYARRFLCSYKVIKKTESKESLADLLEHSETPVELELLEEGQAAGKLMFEINKGRSTVAGVGEGGEGATANTEVPPSATTDSPTAISENGPKQES